MYWKRDFANIIPKIFCEILWVNENNDVSKIVIQSKTIYFYIFQSKKNKFVLNLVVRIFYTFYFIE